MKPAPIPSRLALLLCALLPALAGAAPEPGARRTTILVHAGGKEVAALMVPAGAEGSLALNANQVDDSRKDMLHATGNVRISMMLPNLGPMTLVGDEVFIERETLDADKLKAIRDLEEMGKSDQSVRGAKGIEMSDEDWKRQNALDAANLKRLEEIIARYGWPGLRFAGAAGAQNAFLVLQHAPPESQRKYLPLFREAVAKKDGQPGELAMLEDRVRMHAGQPQLYGTQLEQSPDKTLKLYPIEDEANVDKRRAAVGLGPLADYLKHFGLGYPAR